MQVLAYGTSFDVVDEYLRMRGALARKSLMSFIQGVISCFGDEYLRRPNEDDLSRLLYVGEQCRFSCMIGSIDCIRWELKNCPTTWAGQYARRSGKPTINLEVITSYDLWIYHAFFGTLGSCNDINVLHRSLVFSDVFEGRAQKSELYCEWSSKKNMSYYLTDGIYPSWVAFVKSITSPQIRNHRLFAQHQEAVRKDVERAFGVLQARFVYLRHSRLIWEYEQMGQIMIAWIIMHNIIVEDERETYKFFDPYEFLNDMDINGDDVVEYSIERIADFASFMRNNEQLRNREVHSSRKNDSIKQNGKNLAIIIN